MMKKMIILISGPKPDNRKIDEENDRERENSNSKTLMLKDSSERAVRREGGRKGRGGVEREGGRER